MIDLKRKEDCVGCGACLDTCPVQAICWETDTEGFWYPQVNPERCIDCGLCEKVCPIIHADELNRTNIDDPIPEVFAAYNADAEVRFQSTSGGVYSALADKMLDEGGCLCGAVWTEDFGVRHIVSDKREDLHRIRGSKYLQSDMTGTFKEIRAKLDAGRQVLACGCPCQMAGLRGFLGKDYANLIVVDFICCCINSPKLFKAYVEDLERRYKAKMVTYHPKNKEYGGWHNFAFKATFANGQVYVKHRTEDEFTRCFIGTHIAGRPCCFACRYKQIPRVADMTIADFWGIEQEDPSFDSPKGVSLVLLNNPKGKAFYRSLGASVVSKAETLEQAAKGNGALYNSVKHSSINRSLFYETLGQSNFRAAMDKYGTPARSLRQLAGQLIRYIVKTIK